MSAPLPSDHALTIRADLVLLRRLHLLGAAAALVLAVLVAGPVATWPPLMLGAYALAALVRTLRIRRLRRRLRLEACFTADGPDAAQVRGCAERGTHLWRGCRTLRALQVLARRPPTEAEDRLLYATATFDRVLAPLQPPRRAPEALLPAAAVIWWLAGVPAGAAFPTVAAVGTLALGAVAAEMGLARVRGRLGRRHEAWVEALAAWALDRHAALWNDPSRPYQHTPLYRAPRRRSRAA